MSILGVLRTAITALYLHPLLGHHYGNLEKEPNGSLVRRCSCGAEERGWGVSDFAHGRR